MTRIFVVPAIGTGASIEDAIRPAVPSGTEGVWYRHDSQFLVATEADLTGVPGVVELTALAITAACATWGIDPAALGVVS